MSVSQGLAGLRVAIFESRLSEEFANLLRKQGAQPSVAPSIVEVPLSLGPELREGVDHLRAGRLTVWCVLTGVGQRKLVELLKPLLSAEELAELLGHVLVAARGPKSVAALREIGVRPGVVAPAPHTWRELFEAISSQQPLDGALVALQQYGAPHERLTRAFTDAGASVLQLPVYRWQLPTDRGPLAQMVERIVAGEIDVILFTSGPQVDALLQVARELGVESSLRAALSRIALGSIGPSCSETLRACDLSPDFEPEHGKMGQLVRKAAEVASSVLVRKRGVDDSGC